MDLGQLNQLLEKQSYIGSEAAATLEDYSKARELKSVDATKYPHVARWHAHVTYLAARFPTHDWRGNPIAKGSSASQAMPQAKQENKAKASPKASPKAAPAEAKPKAKQEGKKKGGQPEVKKDEAPAEKTPEQLAEERKKQLKKVIKEGGKRGVE